MGCDIHLFAEAKKGKKFIDLLTFSSKKKWQSIDTWSKNPDFENHESNKEFEVYYDNLFYTGGRNYNLFCALCGVRSHHFITEPKSVSEPKGVPKDVSEIVLSEIQSWGTDGHSHSYNTLKELKEFDWSEYGETVKGFLEEVIPKLEAQGLPDTDVRIVYFFDN